jgi:hypothetical protein
MKMLPVFSIMLFCFIGRIYSMEPMTQLTTMDTLKPFTGKVVVYQWEKSPLSFGYIAPATQKRGPKFYPLVKPGAPIQSHPLNNYAFKNYKLQMRLLTLEELSALYHLVDKQGYRLNQNHQHESIKQTHEAFILCKHNLLPSEHYRMLPNNPSREYFKALFHNNPIQSVHKNPMQIAHNNPMMQIAYKNLIQSEPGVPYCQQVKDFISYAGIKH